jgi:hypothetical protein
LSKFQTMQIIIEVKNHNVFKRLLELLRVTDWLGGIRIWKKENEQSKKELVFDSLPASATPPSETPVDYREFWACIQPQMGIEKVDRLISSCRF